MWLTKEIVGANKDFEKHLASHKGKSWDLLLQVHDLRAVKSI